MAPWLISESVLFICLLAPQSENDAPLRPEQPAPTANVPLERPRPFPESPAANGKIRRFYGRMEIDYDFSDARQALDFSVRAVEEMNSFTPATIEDGALLLPSRAALGLSPPFGAIDGLEFTVTGIQDLTLRLWGDGVQINIWLGDVTQINVDPEDPRDTFAPSDGTHYRLYPWRAYPVEVSIRSSRVYVRVSGTTLLGFRLPDGFPPVRRLSFTTRSEATDEHRPALLKFEATGTTDWRN